MRTHELEDWKMKYQHDIGDIHEHKGHAEKVKRSAAHEKEGYERHIHELEDRVQHLIRELDEWRSRYSKLEIEWKQG